jgi:sulfotransferase
MIEKQYFFLSGLIRSGNTVLSSILNQNPDFHVSTLSPLIDYMWTCHEDDFPHSKTFPSQKNKKNMISGMAKNFYQDIDKPIIFDRNKSWASPDNINMIKKYITKEPKIIFTIRPLHECLASHISIMKDILVLGMNNDIANNAFKYDDRISLNDNLAQHILLGSHYKIYNFAYNSFKNDVKNEIIHIVKYEELLKNPEEVLSEIYNFLKLDNFVHDFNNIKSKENPLDFKKGYPKNLHKVRKTLSPGNLNPYNILSENIINECKKIDFFYN